MIVVAVSSLYLRPYSRLQPREWATSPPPAFKCLKKTTEDAVNQYTTRTGQTLRWSGRNICICTQCDEVFNSPAAFDAHIRRGSGKATHNISKLFRNAAGRLVTSLHEAGATFGSSPAATESDQLVPR